MQTLIVVAAVAVVLLLVFAVIQFASRPPIDESRYSAAASRNGATAGDPTD